MQFVDGNVANESEALIQQLVIAVICRYVLHMPSPTYKLTVSTSANWNGDCGSI